MFFKVKTSEEVLEILKGFDPVGTEVVHIEDALNRVLWRAQRGTAIPYPEWAVHLVADDDDEIEVPVPSPPRMP